MDSNTTLLFYLVIEIASLGFAYLARENQKSFGIVTRKCKYRTAEMYMFVSFFILFSISALRKNVGTDYQTYSEVFSHVKNNTLVQGEKTWIKQSPLFYIVCIIYGKLGFSSNYMFATIAFLTLFFVYRAIVKSSPDWLTSLYLYLCFCLYFQSFNQIRQMLAVAISFYALTWLQKENRKKYVWWILIASGFHMTAAIMLLLLITKDWKCTAKNGRIYILIGVGVFLLFPIIVQHFSEMSYMRIYRDTTYASSFNITSIINLLVRIAMTAICYSELKRFRSLEKEKLVLLNCVVLCVLLQVCAVRFSIFGRLTTYFFMAFLLLIPDVLDIIQKHYTNSSKKVVRAAFFLLFFAYQMVYYFSSAGASGGGYKIYTVIG